MSQATLRHHLIDMLVKPNAHLTFEAAFDNFPEELRGKTTDHFPHTAWQLLEHLRICQWDILEFSYNPDHVSPEFPVGYWPKSPEPPSNRAWHDSIDAYRKDLDDMIMLIGDETVDLFAPIPHGDGQTVLREALVLAKHNSYHLGQVAVLKKTLLGR